MATEILVKIYADGTGDYTSLKAGWDANKQDLVVADSNLVFELKGDLRNTDSFVDASGYTTDATRNITIRPVTGDETTGVAGAKGTIYGTNTYILVCRAQYINFTGLDVDGWGSAFHSAANLTAADCLFHDGGASVSVDAGASFTNCIAYSAGNNTFTGASCHRVTVRRPSGTSFRNANGVITNCVAYRDNTDEVSYFNTTNAANNYNASNDSTAPGDTTYSVTSSDFVDFANNNYNIDPASPLYAAGVGASLPFSGGGGGEVLAIDSGSYTLTGSNVNLTAQYKSTLENGTYSLSGSALGLIRNSKLIADSGTYSLTGTQANLIAARKIIADSGSYNLTGTDVTFIYTPVGGGEVLSIDTGTFSLSGSDIGLKAARLISVNTGSYNLTGQSVALTYNAKTIVDSGSYALTGSNVNLFANRVIIAQNGSYNLTGSTVTLRYSGEVTQTIGTVSTSFAADKYSVSYKPTSITVNFKE